MSRRLGAVETARTGGVKLDQRKVRQLSSSLTRKFEPCAAYGVLVKPPWKSFRSNTTVRDTRTGATRAVDVNVVPDHAVPGSPGWAETHSFQYRHDRHDEVILHLNPEACTTHEDWRAFLRGVLSHELTHASDPYVVISKRKRPPDARGADEDTYCRYVRHPLEQRAFLNQVRHEIMAYPHQKLLMRRKYKVVVRPEHLLILSDTWNAIRRCLTDLQRRRFLQMAARVAPERMFP